MSGTVKAVFSHRRPRLPYRSSGLLNRGFNLLRDRYAGNRFILHFLLCSMIKLFKSLFLCGGAPAPARSGRSILQFVQI